MTDDRGKSDMRNEFVVYSGTAGISVPKDVLDKLPKLPIGPSEECVRRQRRESVPAHVREAASEVKGRLLAADYYLDIVYALIPLLDALTCETTDD